MITNFDYSTWKEFKTELLHHLLEVFGGQRRQYLFRGQRDANWQLVSSFDRLFYFRADRQAIERNLINEFIGLCEDLETQEPTFNDPTGWMPWALGQHHGLPTRLLDWTESPYFAAFFAFEKVLESLFYRHPQPGEWIAIWVAHTPSSAWSHDAASITFHKIPAWRNRRLHAQLGWFSHNQSDLESIEEYVESHPDFEDDVPLAKVTLPLSEARSAMNDLEYMGIHAGSLLGELDGKCRAAKNRVLLDLF